MSEWAELTPFTILRSDRPWTDSPDAGDPGCFCSRCLAVIEERCAPAIRFWPKDGRFEYRFHPHCMGAAPCCDGDEGVA